jgi:beta-phosphoglucomutase-like phosphatase (HAD superfamily)
MQKYSAVIFDCDGVLFDSRRANIHYYKMNSSYQVGSLLDILDLLNKMMG